MKRKTLLFSLALALFLILVMPATALAAKPIEFNAGGTIDSVSPGSVLPAGNSGRWVVHERELRGSISGDINGDFLLTYKANVDEYQAGNFTGKLLLSQDGQVTQVISINGKSQPMDFVWSQEFNTYLPRLSINGHWSFIKGQGTGSFEAWFVFIPYVDEQGNVHVGQIVGSALTMTGKWQP